MSTQQLTPAEQAQWPDTKQSALYGSMGLFLFLGNFTFLLRLGCQLRVARKILVEDALLAFALICVNILIILTIESTVTGLGLHIFRVIAEDPNPPSKVVRIFEYVYITSVLQAACLASVKLALLFLYRRLFLVNQKWLTISWWANVGYVVLWWLGSTFFYIFQCAPVSYYWTRYHAILDPQAPQANTGSCDPARDAILTTLVLSLFSDVFLLILPVATITTLHITPRKKMGLIVVFGFGLVATGVSIGRIVALSPKSVDPSDATYNSVDFLILTAAELVTAIVCACWPIIVPTLIKIGRQESTKTTGTSLPTHSKATFAEAEHDGSDSEPFAKAASDTLDLGTQGYSLCDVEAGQRNSSIGHSFDPAQVRVDTAVKIQHEHNPTSRAQNF